MAYIALKYKLGRKSRGLSAIHAMHPEARVIISAEGIATQLS